MWITNLVKIIIFAAPKNIDYFFKIWSISDLLAHIYPV